MLDPVCLSSRSNPREVVRQGAMPLTHGFALALWLILCLIQGDGLRLGRLPQCVDKVLQAVRQSHNEDAFMGQWAFSDPTSM